MATVASVITVVVVHVTGTAFRSVVPVETEVFVMLEGGRGPAILSVTLPAVALDILMQVIARVAMTAIALLLYGGFQQLMGELTDRTKGLHAFMVAVAGDAALHFEGAVDRVPAAVGLPCSVPENAPSAPKVSRSPVPELQASAEPMAQLPAR